MKYNLKFGDKLICIEEITQYLLKNEIYTFKQFCDTTTSYQNFELIYLREKSTCGPWSVDRFIKCGPVLHYILKDRK